MHYVYLLRSEMTDNKYIGTTIYLKRRLNEHNSGKSTYTNKFKPWRIEMYIAFTDKEKANKFETYLKSGSGRAFTERHL